MWTRVFSKTPHRIVRPPILLWSQKPFLHLRPYSKKPDVPSSELKMPALSPSMETGKVAKWVKKEGDTIEPGDVIAEIETDKATVPYEATDDGVLAKILVEEQSNQIKIGTPIAILVTDKKHVELFKNFTPDSTQDDTPQDSSKDSPKDSSKGKDSPKDSSKGKDSPKDSPKDSQEDDTGPKDETPVPIMAMPALSPTMEQGKITKWVVQEGDAVEAGGAIAEIETDKATVSFDSTEDGFIAKILAQTGVTIKVGTPIAIFVTTKEEIEKYKNYTPEMVSSPKSRKSPKSEDSQKSQDSAESKKSQDSAESKKSTDSEESKKSQDSAESKKSQDSAESKKSQDSAESKKSEKSTPGTRTKASPLARSVASKKGVDIAEVTGTGPDGRVIRADVEEYVPPKKEEVATSKKEAVPTSKDKPVSDFTDFPNSNIRKITAERLTHSKQTIPHYYLSVDITVDKLLELRNELNAALAGSSAAATGSSTAAAAGSSATATAAAAGKDTVKLSVNDFVLKAAALALRAVPEVNSEWRGDHIRRYHGIHINVAVNTPKGLLTPIVKDVDKLGLRTINAEVKAKANRAIEGKISPEDLQTGTFTVSNLGMFGISQFSAVISPPQVAILAVSATKKAPIVVDDTDLEAPKFKVANVMTVTLSCDHRVVDGAVGARWLQVFKDLMENPIKFLL